MKWRLSLMAFLLAQAAAVAQDAVKVTTSPDQPPIPGEVIPLNLEATPPSILVSAQPAPGPAVAGNRNFPGFIGFVSNPIQSIDPRAVTELWPIFGTSSVSSFGPLPTGNFQAYGAGLYVALSDRLSIGLNQGGYVTSHFSRERILRPGETVGRSRDGWVNLGGFVQYTFWEDVPNQFLMTGGLRWEAPSGEAEVFQGHGPAYLAPYLTFGKELGQFHVLGTLGYEFPTRSSRGTVNTFYSNLHLDYAVKGWFYPLVEFNYALRDANGGGGRLPERLDDLRGFFNVDTFQAAGNLLSVSVGANAVIVREKLEFGAVYQTPIYSQNNLDFNGLLVKMVIRY